MSTSRLRRTVTGVGLALSLVLLATPAAQASPARGARRTVHAETTTWNLLSAIWSFFTGTDPRGPNTSQGPTADPNGLS
jgi:hypothetical protein